MSLNNLNKDMLIKLLCNSQDICKKSDNELIELERNILIELKAREILTDDYLLQSLMIRLNIMKGEMTYLKYFIYCIIFFVTLLFPYRKLKEEIKNYYN